MNFYSMRCVMTREEQKAQRRQLIITNALELFVKKGYSETKIGDIAKASNMSVGLMFHYFESKEKFLYRLRRFGFLSKGTLFCV